LGKWKIACRTEKSAEDRPKLGRCSREKKPMIGRRLVKQPRRGAERGDAGRDAEVVRGLEPAMEALRDVQRLQALKLSGSIAVTRVEAVIKRLRLKGATANLPFLIGLAEALEDAVINSTVSSDPG
jgi:hypothetical protein